MECLPKNAAVQVSGCKECQSLLLLVERQGYHLHELCAGTGSAQPGGMVEFSILREDRKGASKTATLDFQRADFELFRTLVGEVPWDSVLKGKGVQEGWMLLKKEVLETQEQAVFLCCKMNWQGKKLAIPQKISQLGNFSEAPGEKECLPPVEKGTGNSWRVQTSC